MRGRTALMGSAGLGVFGVVDTYSSSSEASPSTDCATAERDRWSEPSLTDRSLGDKLSWDAGACHDGPIVDAWRSKPFTSVGRRQTYPPARLG